MNWSKYYYNTRNKRVQMLGEQESESGTLTINNGVLAIKELLIFTENESDEVDYLNFEFEMAHYKGWVEWKDFEPEREGAGSNIILRIDYPTGDSVIPNY